MSDQAKAEELLKNQKLEAELRELKVWSPVKAIAGILTGLLTLGLAYCGFVSATGPLQERLKLEKHEMEARRDRVNNATKAIGDATEAMFSEPSDLALTCLKSDRGTPLLLLVDDEIHFPLLVEPSGGRLLGVGRIGLGSSTKLDDIEVVAALPAGNDCKAWKYLIATSHRESDEKRETRVVVFGLERLGTEAEKYASISPVTFSLLDGMVAYLREGVFTIDEKPGKNKYTVDSQDWSTRAQGKPHEYALEIEAAAASGDDFWIGLKHPLKEGKAVVLRYALRELREALEDGGPAPTDHRLLDLDEHGISALTPWNGNMLVASNPAEGQAYGRSLLYAFAPNGNTWISRGSPISIAQSASKAEGIAVDAENNLWLAYDGARGALVSRRIVQLAFGNVGFETNLEDDGQ